MERIRDTGVIDMSYVNPDEREPTTKKEGAMFLGLILFISAIMIIPNIYYRDKGRWSGAGGYLHYIEAMVK